MASSHIDHVNDNNHSAGAITWYYAPHSQTLYAELIPPVSCDEQWLIHDLQLPETRWSIGSYLTDQEKTEFVQRKLNDYRMALASHATHP